MAEAKTVAILGGGPVGLAAAAHVLERGMEPVVLEAGPDAGHAVRQWAHVRMFSPWEYNIDKAAERLLATRGLERAVRLRLSDRRRAGRAVSRAAGDAHAAQGSHPHHGAGDQRRTRRLRQGQEQGPRGGAVRGPLRERQGAGVAARRRRHRRHRDLAGAQSGGCRRPAGDGRARGAGPARLRHARRAGPRARAAMPAAPSPCWAPAIPPSAP